MRVKNSGNVGIGTAFPSSALDVVGDIEVNGETVTVTLVIIAYVLGRTQYHNVAAMLLVSFFGFGVFAALYSYGSDSAPGLAYYLIVPSILSSMFLSLPLAVGTILANFLGMLIMSRYLPTVSFFDFPLIFLILVSCLLMFSAYYRDVLERDRRAALAESEEKYRTLLETVFEGIAVLERGRIVNTNSGFTRIFGYAQSEMLQRRLDEFIPTAAALLQSIDDGMTKPIKVQGVQKDQTQVDVEIAIKSYSHHARSSQMIAVRDITEQKRIEEALQQAQRLDSIGMLAGGIAHDFNNMLTGIMTQISLAMRKLPADSGVDVHLDKAMRSAESASDLTQQLLAYAGKGTRHIKVFDLSQLVRETVTMLSGSLSDATQIYVNSAAASLPIEADTSQIQQVILNLVINAVEAAAPDDQGEITVTTRRMLLSESTDTLLINGEESLPRGTYAALMVQDTGAGMDEETKQRIFDPFFTTKEAGHGLGLSATLGVVRSHRGVIVVESTPGRGTTFTVLLPLAEESDDCQEAMTSRQQEGPMRIPSVLVIDDDEPVRESVAEILEMIGVQVHTAQDGREGLECFKRYRSQIGLAILDLKMPVMNGAETFHALQALEPNLKIIFSSGYNDDDALQPLKAQGCIDVLPKPYTMDTLIQKVQGALAYTHSC